VPAPRSKLDVNGDIYGTIFHGDGSQLSGIQATSTNIRTITSNDTFGSTDGVILCNAASSNITVALPASTSNSGRVYRFKKIDASVNTCTLDPNGSELIEGVVLYTIEFQNTSVTVVNNGTAWYVF
jgi:hypothetical protein